ncbi:hypothetical protein DH2020_036638 [Rehmannia glutinosa]|uniref:Transmembrane protein n=1 Tax=Rehmannia glutinosa TaxID=99300 RepID=A0ABR0V4C7_REHGL
MSKITNLSSLRFFSCLLSSFSLLLIPGSADNPSTSDSSNNNTAASKKSSGTSTPLTILFTFIGLLAVGAFSVFLYKLWQRKKREEQHARLLKLFEQDDELEVELGIRD